MFPDGPSTVATARYRADPDQFGARGKIWAGAPLYRSQLHNEFTYTHKETAYKYWRFYFF